MASEMAFTNQGVEDASSQSYVSDNNTPPESETSQSNENAPALPYRLKEETASLTLHAVSEQDGLIVSIAPPEQPVHPVKHMPCDIVLVIDVSGSMNSAAPVPGETTDSKAEQNGLSVLDLTKHAARTILYTLDKEDRLAIVTFSSEAKVLQPLLSMTEEHKKEAEGKINGMEPLDATNLWHGITTGISLFDDNARSESVPAIMVLTDGLPNHLCPAKGYVPKLRTMDIPATIHTFGFGYAIRSGLLKSIAEIGCGGYSFIPDAGMIGTVFVHAVANLQSTFATNAVITLKSRVPLKEVMGKSVKQEEPVVVDSDGSAQLTTIHLGNIQYGQSRDIFIAFDDSSDSTKAERNPGIPLLVEAELHYSSVAGGNQVSSTICNVNGEPALPKDMVAYHRTRAQICSLLSSFFPMQSDGEYTSLGTVPESAVENVHNLIESIKALGPGITPEPLLADLSGQISMALSRDDYYSKWGRHYLPSLLSSHTSQSCNSFKDPGPLEYGKASPLFIQCRDALDAAFDNLPPPKPSRRVHKGTHRTVNMRKYNRSSNPCFAGACKVTLSTGRQIPLRLLRPGMSVATPAGPRRVDAVVKTRAPPAPAVQQSGTEMCLVGSGLLVTPYHPISVDGGRAWVFPIDEASAVPVVARRLSVYSVLLQPDSDEMAHGIFVGGCLGVTLGHGLTKERRGDVRGHAFFGDYQRVARSLKRLRKDKNGVTIGNGVVRHGPSGLVTGFRPTRRVLRK